MSEVSPSAGRMKRNLLFVVLFLIVVAAGAFLYFKDRRYKLVITQEQIDAALKEKFPITKTHLVLFQITYSNPHAKPLPDSNRIEVGLDAEVMIKALSDSKKLTGTVFVTGALSYRDDKKQFFLVEPEIKKISIQGIPQQYIDKVTDFASKVAQEYIQEVPVYTLKDGSARTTAAKLLLRDVEVKQSEVHVTLGY
jgi:hypothetical protein